jgi:hypothetical protein
MEYRLHTCKKKHILADGTVKYYEFQNKYYPVKEKKGTREKKPGAIYGIDCILKELSVGDRILVEEYARGLLEKARVVGEVNAEEIADTTKVATGVDVDKAVEEI